MCIFRTICSYVCSKGVNCQLCAILVILFVRARARTHTHTCHTHTTTIWTCDLRSSGVPFASFRFLYPCCLAERELGIHFFDTRQPTKYLVFRNKRQNEALYRTSASFYRPFFLLFFLGPELWNRFEEYIKASVDDDEGGSWEQLTSGRVRTARGNTGLRVGR